MKIWLHRGELIKFLSLPLKSNQLSLVRSNFRETLKEVSTSEYLQMYGELFDIYCQSNDMAESPVLQGKLEIPDLNSILPRPHKSIALDLLNSTQSFIPGFGKA